MRVHEKTTLSSGKERCKHCGAAWPASGEPSGVSCVDRPNPAPAPRRRVSVLDDIDATHERLGELKTDREAIEAAKAPEVQLADFDAMLGDA